MGISERDIGLIVIAGIAMIASISYFLGGKTKKMPKYFVIVLVTYIVAIFGKVLLSVLKRD